jgi:hypothetical protein
MGRLIAVLALAGAAAFAARPSSHANARLSSPESAPAAIARNADDVAFVQAEKDLAGREAELGLVGAAPLFGAEGLPKPQR